MNTLTEEQRHALLTLYYNQVANGGSKFPGMTYEDGINAVIMLMDGDCDLDEVINE